jgi:hypothetical protein
MQGNEDLDVSRESFASLLFALSSQGYFELTEQGEFESFITRLPAGTGEPIQERSCIGSPSSRVQAEAVQIS